MKKFMFMFITSIVLLSFVKPSIQTIRPTEFETTKTKDNVIVSEFKDLSVNTSDLSINTSHTSDVNNVDKINSEESWKLVLVNKDNLMEDGYVPELEAADNRGFYFDKRAVGELKRMLKDAKDAGLSMIICSSYRTWEKQTTLFNKEVAIKKANGFSEAEAIAKTKTQIAYPGTSEHQLGLAVDIVALDYQLLNEKQAETPEQQWLMKNCANYGFILRYPLDKSDITGVIFEPWHYRYVGKEVAKEIMKQNISLEEYLTSKK